MKLWRFLLGQIFAAQPPTILHVASKKLIDSELNL
jgi:hypothetical protein